MNELALKFLEYFGIGVEELSKMSPLEQTLFELIPFVIGLSLMLGIFFAISGFGKREVQAEEGKDMSELDKEIELIKALQRR